MRYLALLLLLVGCLDLDQLTYERCPDRYMCPTGKECIDEGEKGKFCNSIYIPPDPNPKEDMSQPQVDMRPVDPMSLACFKMYDPTYQDSWYMGSFYGVPGGVPRISCPDCKVNSTSTKCQGRVVKEWFCMDSSIIMQFTEDSQIQGYKLKMMVDTKAGNTKTNYSEISNGGLKICSYGSDPCPSQIYTYNQTYCDQYN